MNYYEPDERQRKSWGEWIESRPPAIAEIARRFPPWGLYRLVDSRHRCTVVSFHEGDPATVTVAVTGEFNYLVFARSVFGIPAENLVPCELPAPGEALGEQLTDPDEIEAFCIWARENNL